MSTAVERFHENEFVKKKTVFTTEGFIIEGECFHVAPYNQRLYLELDTPAGVVGGIFLGFMSQLGKWGFHREKVEEWMEVSPANPTHYQMTIQQKQQLEGQIKAGLAGIASAVSDFELLFHDLRKYREFMEYFNKIERGKKENKPELIAEGTQTLKAIFVDQVDVHTGEGVALKLIAPRWPTIIADFMKLKPEDIDPKKIAEKYRVSEAEGVVLATKNKLFLVWADRIKETVLGRFERIRGLMEARKKSIEEYKTMLTPYITRYRYIREFGETPEGRRAMEAASWIKPAGTLLITSAEMQTIWVWRAFAPPELFKAAAEVISELPGTPLPKKSIFKIPFPREFKEWIRVEYDRIKEKFSSVSVSPTGIEPLDKWVLLLFPEIEKKYKIKFALSDILEAREKFLDQYNTYAWNWVRSPYFMVLELPITKLSFRVDGKEFETLILSPKMKSYIDTQNIILLRMLELKAKERELENYISEMLGETVKSETIKNIIKGEYPFLMGEEEKKPEVLKEKKPSKAEEFIRRTLGLDIRFFKPGKYETHFDDRISGQYMREMADYLWVPTLRYLKGAVGVPGL